MNPCRLEDWCQVPTCSCSQLADDVHSKKHGLHMVFMGVLTLVLAPDLRSTRHRKGMEAGTAEKKIAILERGLEHHPGSEQLLLAMLNVVRLLSGRVKVFAQLPLFDMATANHGRPSDLTPDLASYLLWFSHITRHNSIVSTTTQQAQTDSNRTDALANLCACIVRSPDSLNCLFTRGHV